MKHYMLFVLCLLAMSCSKDKYSCDPFIDAWVKENLNFYETADRDKFVRLPISRQRAVYRGLSGAKKVELWNEKLLSILLDEKLSDSEKIAIKSLYDNISVELFENDAIWMEFQPYLHKWQTFMIEHYNWDEAKFFMYCHIWMSDEELRDSILYDSIITKTSSLNPDTGSSDKCTCLTDTFCAFADGLSHCDIENNKCRISDGGCGIFGRDDCKGTCK